MKHQKLDFAEQVVLVTGAGRGLGRAYAELFAERGAVLACNDLDDEIALKSDQGSAASGSGGGPLGELQLTGSAVDGGDLVERLLARTGRIDAMVLNAGFLRDRSFAKATEQDFRDLLDVHLIGPWRAAKAAWPTMVAQGFGRIVLTTSPAGLYGGFGQSSYGACKAGLIGLMRTLAIEGAKHGIYVNCVAPLAASRLSSGVLPAVIAEHLPASSIAGLVAYLCHPSCTTTGQIFEAAGGSFARQILHRNLGVHLGRDPSPETVRDAWLDINDLIETEDPSSSADSLVRLVKRWPDAADFGVIV